MNGILTVRQIVKERKMKHPCSGCKAKIISHRITCPILWREIALEGCNRIHNMKPKEALRQLASMSQTWRGNYTTEE